MIGIISTKKNCEYTYIYIYTYVCVCYVYNMYTLPLVKYPFINFVGGINHPQMIGVWQDFPHPQHTHGYQWNHQDTAYYWDPLR